jgi:hypothetical protein
MTACNKSHALRPYRQREILTIRGIETQVVTVVEAILVADTLG